MRRARAEFDIEANNRVDRVLKDIRGQLGGIGNTARMVARLTGGIFAADQLRRLTLTADRYGVLTRRIRTATKDTGDFETVYAQLLQTAAETGGAFEEQVEIFQGLSRIREDIGATNEQFLAFTRTVSQLGVIGATSAAAQNAGLRQLNQGLAAGIFRAEEYNSIVENLPELASRLADGFGLTQGELRNLVLEGELMSQDVMRVILEQAGDINEEFREMPVNLGRATQNFETALGTALARLDDSLSLTRSLATLINEIAFQINPQIDGHRQIVELKTQEVQLEEAIKQRMEEGKEEATLQGKAVAATIGLLERGPAPIIAMNAAAEALFGETLGTMAREQLENTGAVASASLGELQSRLEDIRSEIHALTNLQAVDVDTSFTKRPGGLSDEDREVMVQDARDLFAELHQVRLRAEEDEAELARLDYEAFVEDLNSRRVELERHGELTEGLNNRFRQAELDAEMAYRLQLAEIMKKADEEELQRRTAHFGKHQKTVVDLMKWESKNAEQRTAFILGTVQDLSSGLAQTNETMFKVNKAAALANAVMSTAAGVAKALELPFPTNLVAAAIVGAKGAAEIATIQATQFGGGPARGSGSQSGVPSLATESPTAAPSALAVDERDQNAAARPQRLVVEAGDSELARAIARQLRVVTDEEDVVLFGSNSRQALELKGA